MPWVAEVAHHMALLPLVTLVVTEARGRKVPRVYWWVGAALLVSWVADSLAHYVSPAVVSFAYPVSQAVLVWAGLVSVVAAFDVLMLLSVLALVTLLLGWSPLALRVVAFGSVVFLAGREPSSLLRTSVLTTFGLGLGVWVWYTRDPGWTSWGVYQGVRALGIGLFCVAVSRPRLA